MSMLQYIALACTTSCIPITAHTHTSL